jgi:hypothetical protein
MAKVKTELLEKGMVVSTAVKNSDNMLLVPQGCELTDRQINILLSWGIAEVEIEGAANLVEEDPLAKLPPEVVAEITGEIKQRFWLPFEDSPVYIEIVKLMVQRRARRHAPN